jgi:hypothetical protein
MSLQSPYKREQQETLSTMNESNEEPLDYSIRGTRSTNSTSLMAEKRPSHGNRITAQFTLGIRIMSSRLLGGILLDNSALDERDILMSSIEGKLRNSVLDDSTSLPSIETNRPFSFPVKDLKIVSASNINLTLGNFTEIIKFASGTNSDVSTAKLMTDLVAIKMLKTAKADDDYAKLELDIEHGILGRLDHPHIIKMFGAGNSPRRFMVLEFLHGGTLNQRFQQKLRRKSLRDIFFRPEKFPLSAGN